MSIREVEQLVQTWPREDQEELREWLENLLEDQLGLTEAFKASIDRGLAQLAAGEGRLHKH